MRSAHPGYWAHCMEADLKSVTEDVWNCEAYQSCGQLLTLSHSSLTQTNQYNSNQFCYKNQTWDGISPMQWKTETVF